jgi:hypothetical protein
MRELQTVAEVFEALGGIAEVARIAGTSYNAASNWKSFNRFPPKTFLLLQTELDAMGLRADPDLWGMEKPR